MPEAISQSTPILKPFVVCFVTCTNSRLLAIRKIMSACWRLAVLVSVAVPSIGKVVFTWVKGIYQGIPRNPKVSPHSTGEWTVYPNQFFRLDRDCDLVSYPQSIFLWENHLGEKGEGSLMVKSVPSTEIRHWLPLSFLYLFSQWI
jgi:hypothetical protein